MNVEGTYTLYFLYYFHNNIGVFIMCKGTSRRYSGHAGHNDTPLPTYLLTPWSRVLLEKLTGSAASQEIPRIFGTRRFITVLTSARHLSLFWANSIQSSQPPPTSWRSILILSSLSIVEIKSRSYSLFLMSLRIMKMSRWYICIGNRKIFLFT